MRTERYKIAVSCIGSGVGQSVIDSIRLSNLPVETIGLGTNPFAFGAYDCNTYDYTSNIYDPNYIENLISKCREHKVDLIIPGHDDEVKVLAKNIRKLNAENMKAICPGDRLVSLCRDKELMSRELNKVVDAFVRSYELDQIESNLNSGKIKLPLLAKPKSGYASKGIFVINSSEDLSKITENHIVQEIALPRTDDPHYHEFLDQLQRGINNQVAEISVQIVADQEGQIVGRMATYNRLRNGEPIEILPYENGDVWQIIDQLTPFLIQNGLRGPLNIQGRLTDRGFRIFEMNPRFTGITGMRAMMGFNEVEFCIREWLGVQTGNQSLKPPSNRFGVRQTASKVIGFERNHRVANLSSRIHSIGPKVNVRIKTVFVTGGSGYLGQALVDALIQKPNLRLVLLERKKDQIKQRCQDRNVEVFDYFDLEQGICNFGSADLLLHLAFTRPFGTAQEVSESLRMTKDLFTAACLSQIPAILNISSQSVYDPERTEASTERSPVGAKTPYAQAKYASELILEALGRSNPHVKYTSLRFATLAGGSPGLKEVDVLSKFVRDALQNKPLIIENTETPVERLDIRDAVTAILRLIDIEPTSWETLYNLGPVRRHSLLDIGKIIQKQLQAHQPAKEIKIISKSNSSVGSQGIDSTKLYEFLNWKPQYGIGDTIDSLIAFYNNTNEKTK